MTKKYKLLKPLPDGARIGDEYVKGEYRYYNKRMHEEAKGVIESVDWETWQVENNPDWFSEVKEQERIEVSFGYVSGEYEYSRVFFSNKRIEDEKFPAIKQAIEFVLNNEPTDVKIGDYTFKFQAVPAPTIYTQQQLDKAIEDAFAAARSGDIIPPELGSRMAFGFKHTYPLFRDYLNSIK